MLSSHRTIALLSVPLAAFFLFAGSSAQLNAAGIGKKLWEQNHDSGLGNDGSFGVTIDGSGQVLPVGALKAGTLGSDTAGHAKKYTASGSEINTLPAPGWPITEDSSLYARIDQFIDAAMDSGDNLLVASYNNSSLGSVELTVCKFDSNGSRWWQKQNGSTGQLDEAETIPRGPGGIAVDGQDNVFACGTVTDTGTGDPHWLIVGYDSAGNDIDGNESGGPFPLELTFHGRAWDLAVDSQGDFIVVGSTSTDGSDYAIHIRKYHFDHATKLLTLSWEESWNPNSLRDVAFAVTVDSNDDVIIAGTTHNGADYDWLVAKYAAAGDGSGNGIKLWEQIVNAPSFDQVLSVVADDLDNLYFGGTSNDQWRLEYRDGDDGGRLLLEQDWNSLPNSQLYGLALRDNKLALAGYYLGDTDYDWHVELYDLAPFSWPMFLPAIVTP